MMLLGNIGRLCILSSSYLSQQVGGAIAIPLSGKNQGAHLPMSTFNKNVTTLTSSVYNAQNGRVLISAKHGKLPVWQPISSCPDRYRTLRRWAAVPDS
jgi:hypothetical protein